jgi:murein DD-endopeptidase MepM/ murein hydrolase activator NlpD
MNFGTAITIWSFHKEFLYVAMAFLVVLSLPVIAVVILTQTGINIVSDKLATLDSINKTIEIHDPKDGSVVKEINSTLVWPVRGRITLEFGVPHLPYQLFHTGIDIATKKGDDITPFMDGTVTYAEEIFWGYGKHIIIDHGDNITSLYGHLDRIYVFKGQKVKIGDVIGKEGSTGWSTGPHLHLQINVYGIPVNPRTFLGEQ